MSELRGTRSTARYDAVSHRSQRAILPGENATIWTLWLTYGAFYFCRQNLSTAVPGMKLSVAESGLGLSSDQVGWILASLKITYGLGQLVNGQLSERVPPRVMLTLGMFGSAALNVLFGFSTGFYFLLFVWAMNGYCQSLGWTPCVRVAANWIPVARRGHAIGIIGTGYQITLGLTFLIASQAAQLLGWRGALYVPAVLLALTGIFMLVYLREAPDRQPAGTGGETRMSPLPARLSFSESLFWTLYNPTLWLLGLSLGLLNACRYGFLDWGVTHLMETRDVRVGKAGLQFFVIAIGAVAGSYLAGWATDRWFGGRRGPVICVLMAVLGGLSLVYDDVVQSSVVGSMLLLVIIGFCIYGPQVLLVGTAPADLAHRGTSAAAAGFVNFMGYIGAATGDVVTGYYSAPEHGGWQTAIYIWAGWAFGGAAIMAVLWNTTTGKVGLVPAIVPKLAAMISLGLASAATAAAGQPTALPAAAILAAGCIVGTLVTRWAAVLALAIAMASLMYLFGASIQGTSDVSWQLSTALVSYGLTIICTVMILVEHQRQPCESS
jgi:sugar phosphate permease